MNPYRQIGRQRAWRCAPALQFGLAFIVHWAALGLGHAQLPDPLARSGDNPALERFARSIVFYVSFDGHALAEIAPGNPAPVGNTNWTAAVAGGGVEFEDGVSGQGLVSRSYQFNYRATGAVFRASGSLALWLKPKELHHVGNYFWPAHLHAASGYGVMIGRMGDPRNKEALYAHLSHAKARVSSIQASMAGWKTNDWHLLVATWDRDGLGFSVDGATPSRAALRAPIPGDAAEGFRVTLSGANDDTFTFDEFMILDIPLDGEEIRWLWQQGRVAWPIVSP